MSIFSERDKLFGDFSSDPDAVEAWGDFGYLFKQVLPDLGVKPESFDNYFPLFADRTNSFLAMLFSQSDDPVIQSYGKTFLQDIENEHEGGIRGFFESSKNERILGGHAYFIKNALFEVLQNVCHEFKHEPFSDPIKPDKDFKKRFAPYAFRYMPHVAIQSHFASTNLASFYAALAPIDEGYAQGQKEGLEDFAELYIENIGYIGALEGRYAQLITSKKMLSIAHDFNAQNEMVRCKMDYANVLLNLFAQAFDMDIPKTAIRNLEGSLAVALHDEDMIAFDTDYIDKTGLKHLFETIAHEFCHLLQKRELTRLNDNFHFSQFNDLDDWDKMVFFFQHSMYRSPEKDESDTTLYDENIKERDADNFGDLAHKIVQKHILHYAADQALRSIESMQPNAANG